MPTLRNQEEGIWCKQVERNSDSEGKVFCPGKTCAAIWSYNGTTSIIEKGCSAYAEENPLAEVCGEHYCEAFLSESSVEIFSPTTHHICCCRQDFCNENLRSKNIVTNTAGPTVITKSGEEEIPEDVFLNSEFPYLIVTVIVVLIILSVCFGRKCLPHAVKCIKYENNLRKSLRKSRPDAERQVIESAILLENPVSAAVEETIFEGRYGRILLGNIGHQSSRVCIKEFYTSTQHGRELYEKEKCCHITLRCFNHQNIISYIGDVALSECNESPKIALEYCAQGSLRQYLKRYVIDFEGCISFLCDIARAVSFLHNPDRSVLPLGMAHRDISSSNFLVKRNKTIVITDFGLSMPFSGVIGESCQKMDMAAVGTLNYMAPEILRGTVNLHNYASALKQADVYSTALVMWEVVNRCSAFRNSPESVPKATLPYQLETSGRKSLYDVVVVSGMRPAFPLAREIKTKTISTSSTVSTDSGHISDGTPILADRAAENVFYFPDNNHLTNEVNESLPLKSAESMDSKTICDSDSNPLDSKQAIADEKSTAKSVLLENHISLALLKRTIVESWDVDEEARLTAPSILNRVSSFL